MNKEEISTLTTDDFYEICKYVSTKAESKFENSNKKDDVLLGMTYTAAILGYAYKGKVAPITFDSKVIKKMYGAYISDTQKPKKKPKYHQITIEEYIKSLLTNKEK